jgi:hypothetical protein
MNFLDLDLFLLIFQIGKLGLFFWLIIDDIFLN